MKSFIRVIFIFLLFLVTQCAQAVNVPIHEASISAAEYSDTIISPEEFGNKVLFVTPSTRNYQITISDGKKDSIDFHSFDKIDDKNFSQIYISNYNKILCRVSHNISSYLKYEICTRAP